MNNQIKKLRAVFIILMINLLIGSSVDAQSPQKMSYQAVIRDAANVLITNHLVGMKISILQGSPSGTAVYVETQTPTSNTNGLVSIEVGGGMVVSGTFASIDWSNGPYFIKTETDPAGGTTYTISGTSQLLSVPYALSSASLTLPFVNSSSYTTPPLSIEDTGSSLYTIQGLSNSGCGIYGQTSGSTASGVLGIGTGADYSSGVVGRSGEGNTTTLPGNCGVLGQADTNIGVAGMSISGIGGFFLSQTGKSLKTVGNIQLTGIGESAGKVLTSDGSGNASWQNITASGLNLPFSATINSSSIAFEVINSDTSAIHGVNSSLTKAGIGVIGETFSSNGYGIWGGANSLSGNTYGVYGTVNSSNGIGVYGISPNIAIKGMSTGVNGYGLYGQSNYIGTGGIASPSTGTTYGIVGISLSTSGEGVFGSDNASNGVTYGVHGMVSSASGFGVYGEGPSIGVKGSSSGTGSVGVLGVSTYIGIKGQVTSTTGSTYAVYGETSSAYGFGVYGSSPYVGVYGSATNNTGWGGYFNGKVGISGYLGVGTAYPSYQLDVAGTANLNSNTSGVALRCNGAEAIWFNDTYFSWGYGGTYNYFSDKVFIGATATDPGTYLLVVNGSAAKPGGGSWSTWSDKRLKDIHGNYEKGLKEIMLLQAINYSYKKDNIRKLPSDKNYVGFIAQDVQKIFPEAVNEENDGYLTLDMNSINVAMINAIKELKADNDKLKAENEQMKIRLDKLESMMEKNIKK